MEWVITIRGGGMIVSISYHIKRAFILLKTPLKMH
ncbi:MAG: hypothetical protein ACI8ZV_002634, partial [Chitinophagales bacterium]